MINDTDQTTPLNDDANDLLITDESSDRKYFVLIPRIVAAYARDPYDYTFWAIVKDIAGEKGECILDREALAMLSMMSAGKISSCREYWMSIRFLRGELKRDEGHPKAVWHLKIPDLWEENVKWSKEHRTLKDRMTFKAAQADSIVPPPQGASTSKTFVEKVPSCGDGSGVSSCGDGSDQKPSLKKVPSCGVVKEELLNDGIQKNKKNQLAAKAAVGAPSDKRSQILSTLEKSFSTYTGLRLPQRISQAQKREAGRRWWTPLWTIFTTCGSSLTETDKIMREAIAKLRQEQLTIYAPQSIEKTAVALYAERNGGGSIVAIAPQLEQAQNSLVGFVRL